MENKKKDIKEMVLIAKELAEKDPPGFAIVNES